MDRVERTFRDPSYHYDPNQGTLSSLLETLMGGPPDMTGWRVMNGTPAVPMGKPKISSSVSPDFQPVAPLKNYVPQWKQDKMAQDKMWQDYQDRLQKQPLSAGLTNFSSF